MLIKKTALALITTSFAINLWAVEPEIMKLGIDSQKSVSLTIYNNNFAVVKEVREVSLPKGLVELNYLDVPKHIEPSSLLTHSTKRKDAVTVLQQSYQNRPVNRTSILESFIGRKLKYSREVLNENKYEKILREGILLSINPEIVEFGDVIEISPPGVISLPYLPEGLNLSPTLVWLLDNKISGPQDIETSYVTSNIRWQADYTITLDKTRDEFDLGSWITVSNQSGVDFSEAKIDLVAGEVNRVAPRPMMMARNEMQMGMAS
ncbi:MAG: hypothetical protein ACI9FB_002786, partial [Candidatus Azotimanducaceae bacterium]